jgi:hypothetical protein
VKVRTCEGKIREMEEQKYEVRGTKDEDGKWRFGGVRGK